MTKPLLRGFAYRSRGQKLSDADIVRMAKDWDAEVGSISDIHACACCGIEDFQQVHAQDIHDLAVSELNDGNYLCTLRAYRKYYWAVHELRVEEVVRYFWLPADLVDNDGETAPLCPTCLHL